MTSQVLQLKKVNKQYRGHHTYISLYIDQVKVDFVNNNNNNNNVYHVYVEWIILKKIEHAGCSSWKKVEGAVSDYNVNYVGIVGIFHKDSTPYPLIKTLIIKHYE